MPPSQKIFSLYDHEASHELSNVDTPAYQLLWGPHASAKEAKTEKPKRASGQGVGCALGVRCAHSGFSPFSLSPSFSLPLFLP